VKFLYFMKKELSKAITNFIVLAILVIGASVFLIFREDLVGPAYILLGFVGVGLLRTYKIKIEEVSPDIVFGLIDNGVLVFTAILGGIYAGVAGAVLGGAAGNTITDGIGGLFEGRIAKKLRKKNIVNKRGPLPTMLGKMIGCLLGAGIAFTLLFLLKIIFNWQI